MPVPWMHARFAASPRTNLSKIRDLLFRGNADALVTNAEHRRTRSNSVSTQTVRRSGEYLTAFSSRFRITRSAPRDRHRRRDCAGFDVSSMRCPLPPDSLWYPRCLRERAPRNRPARDGTAVGPRPCVRSRADPRPADAVSTSLSAERRNTAGAVIRPESARGQQLRQLAQRRQRTPELV